VCGSFAAGGSSFEAEIWCRMDGLQAALKREDLSYSYVAVLLAPGAGIGEIREFCGTRRKLEIEATPETEYYRSLSKHYVPVRFMAWLIVVLLAGAGVFAGLNAMYGAVVGRVRELATLQTVGFPRRALVLALVQEAVLLSALACLLASVLALVIVHGLAIRFTMGAFTLEVDAVTLLWGYGVGLGLGIVGAAPPAWRALRLPIAEGLKAV
jgi:ABC-type lipoprotein release transport system permease subunit